MLVLLAGSVSRVSIVEIRSGTPLQWRNLNKTSAWHITIMLVRDTFKRQVLKAPNPGFDLNLTKSRTKTCNSLP